MGVPGFLTFLSENKESSFRERKLENSYLVIDGNNAYRWFYKKVDIETKLAGNYVWYHDFLTRLFQNFSKCNITPIVVFDGVTSKDKDSVRFTRWQDKIKKLRHLKTGRIQWVLPPLLFNLFSSVLRELRVIHFTALLEADKEIANIAKLLNCPVLSEDSDYCFYNIELILISKMDVQMKVDKTAQDGHQCYFDCLVFDNKRFMERFNINEELFLMIPVLVGNEHHQGNTFHSFLTSTIQVAEIRNNTCFASYEKLLVWLQGMKSLQCSVKYISTVIENSSEAEIWKIINDVMQFYSLTDKLETPYVKINKNECTIVIDDSTEKLLLPDEHPLSKYPKDIIRGYIQGFVNPVHIKSAYNDIIHCDVYYENIEECSSSEITLPLFCAQLRIADRIGGFDFVRRLRMRNRHNGFREIRLYNSEKFLSTVTSDIFIWEIHRKRKFFLEIVGFEDGNLFEGNEINEEWHLFLICVAYWMKHKQTFMRAETYQLVHLECVLITALGLHLVGSSEWGEKCNAIKRSSLSQLTNIIPQWEISLFTERIKYCRSERRNIDMSIRIIHGFTLLQNCLKGFIELNEFLRYPFPDIKIERFFSGELAYDVNNGMSDPDFIDNLMESSPTLRRFFDCLTSKVDELSHRLGRME